MITTISNSQAGAHLIAIGKLMITHNKSFEEVRDECTTVLREDYAKFVAEAGGDAERLLCLLEEEQKIMAQLSDSNTSH